MTEQEVSVKMSLIDDCNLRHCSAGLKDTIWQQNRSLLITCESIAGDQL